MIRLLLPVLVAAIAFTPVEAGQTLRERLAQRMAQTPCFAPSDKWMPHIRS